MRLLLALLLASGPSAALAAADTAPLGKLFLTPERRQALERQRQFNLREAEAGGGDVVRLDGVVQRSNGRSSVWINQRMQSEQDKARVERKTPAEAELKLENEATTRLRVGESINRSTQERKDVVAPGAVGAGRP